MVLQLNAVTAELDTANKQIYKLLKHA